jgi:acyl-CoA dehydrogenase
VDKVVAVDAFPMHDVSPIAAQHDRRQGDGSGDGARREAAE